jgi:preprotein translocase subunit SecY
MMTGDLARRIAFTIGALLLYRLGLAIALPGIDMRMWTSIFRPDADAFGTTIFLSNTHHQLAIFALGILPYVTAAVLLQITALFSRTLRARAENGELGRRSIVTATRYLTIPLAAFQAWGIAQALERIEGVVRDPGPLFIMTTIVTLTAGTLFLAWLADQITLRGVGNGIALILVAGSGLQLPGVVAHIVELSRQGGARMEVLGLVVIVIAVTTLIVWIELARRKIPVRFPSETGGTKLQTSPCHLDIKLNPAGIIPVLLAGWLIGIATVLGFLVRAVTGYDPSWMWTHLTPGAVTYAIVSCVLIIFFTFFYTAFVLDPEAAAERLNRLGGVIPGVAPGEETAAHIDQAVSRAAMVGAVYLALVFLLPHVLGKFLAPGFIVGGATLLIAVCTMLDVLAQFRAEWRKPEPVGDNGD